MASEWERVKHQGKHPYALPASESKADRKNGNKGSHSEKWAGLTVRHLQAAAPSRSSLWPRLSRQSFPALGSPDPPLLTCLGRSASI